MKYKKKMKKKLIELKKQKIFLSELFSFKIRSNTVVVKIMQR